MQGQIQGDAIVLAPRCKVIMQRQSGFAQQPELGKAFGVAAFTRQQFGQGPLQAAFIGLAQASIPGLQTSRTVDFGRNAIQIPARLPGFIGHQTGAAQTCLFFPGLGQGGQIAFDKPGPGIDFSRHQGLAHEKVMGFGRIQTAVMHRSLGRQHETEQADLFVTNHAPLRARPVRIKMPA